MKLANHGEEPGPLYRVETKLLISHIDSSIDDVHEARKKKNVLLKLQKKSSTDQNPSGPSDSSVVNPAADQQGEETFPLGC